MQSSRTAGVSLLELTIVVLIMALLTAALVMGRSMIEQAEIRSSIGDIDRIKKAIQVFSDKYHQLPGDFNRAEEFWGADASCPTTTLNETPKKATCDGDGLGTIATCCHSNTYEIYRMWQHLANAGMFEGSFSGTGGQISPPARLLGPSIPAAPIAGGGYTVLIANYPAATAENFAMEPRHVIEFGAIPPACATSGVFGDCVTRYKLLTPENAQVFDAKIDDGKPGTGNVMSHPPTSVNNPDCTLSATAYNIAHKASACAMIVNTGY